MDFESTCDFFPFLKTSLGVWVYVRAVCMLSAFGGKKEALGLLVLELWTVVSLHVGTET